MDFSVKLEEFLREKYEAEILKAKKEGRPSITIDFQNLDKYDLVLADQLLENPQSILSDLKTAVISIADEVVTVRIKNLPASRNIRIRNLRAEHLNKFWIIDCTVKSASEVKPQIYEVSYECPSCGTILNVRQESGLLQKPEVCDCGRRGDFKNVSKKMFDIRWLNAIEPFEITTGEQPGEITIFLKEDLTTPKMQKLTDPGSRLRIYGVLRELPKRIKGRLSTRMDMYIEASFVESAEIEYEDLEITEENKLEIVKLASDPNIYEKLKASIAPGIYGFDEIKEALMLQLFGGIPHKLPDGSRIRGNVHILITGDPGTGKSQMLKLISSVVPRGRYVSGSGVSGAGLCTAYDTLIQLGNGRLTEIGKIVEKKMEKGREKIDDGIWVTEGDGEDVLALAKDFKIKPKKITKYWKLRSPEKLVQITTVSGRKIKVTEENPMPVLSEKGKIVWVLAKDLKKTDHLAVPGNGTDSGTAFGDVFRDKVKETRHVSGGDYVYDITVEEEHSFVANGMIIHNTATVRKDENLGSWVLEAGALILCNRGLISIDEFDKMNRDDQIAMHEAMSLESVSIAKASIVATLPAETAVLAGANPKHGRFDPGLSVAEQIQIPETLLSRFDLKFALKDKPDRGQDERLAEHILISREKPELIEPVIPIKMLKKYLAYARQIKDLELSEEAGIALKNFYVDMRNRYVSDETQTISITLRQYEALIRLAEASAKIRLDTKVRMEDAERAINLMRYSLSQLGTDMETGRIDIDKVEGGVTASKRRKITIILDIITELQKSGEVAVEDVRAEAESQGVENVDEVLDRLKREGTIFEPKSGFIRKV